MKKYILIILLVSSYVIPALAQVDRSKAPTPGPAPEIKIGEYQSFELKNGLKVFVIENHKLPRISFSLLFDHKPVIEGNKAGYVGFSGQLLRNGTTNRTKAQLDEEIDFIGASLSTTASGVYASSLVKHKQKLLDLMTDVLFNPAFPEDELEKIRKQAISSIAGAKDDPDAIASDVTRALLYGENHPYGEITTEETVKNITLDDCKAYYKKYFIPNQGYLAVVGDITFKDAKKLVTKYFKDWEKGPINEPTYAVPQAPNKQQVAMVHRSSSVQSVLRITYPIELHRGDPDVIKTRVLNQVLGGGFSSRLMQNLREDKAYTYGARSSITSDDLVGNFNAYASVRNEVTDSAVHEFISELKRIRETKITDDELNAAKAYIIGSFARSLESPQTIANFAINRARYNLPDDYYTNYLKRVADVTAEDVQEMAKKYILPDHTYIVVVGKASEVADKLEKFGDLHYYDIYGNEYVPGVVNVPLGLTADKVIATYLEAVGGREKLRKVKSINVDMSAEIMGNEVEMKVVKKMPGKLLVEASMMGNIVNRQIMNGDYAMISSMGNKIPIDESTREELKINSYPFPELFYEDLGIKTTLVGVEKVDTKDAYVVELVYPSGVRSTEYYDVTSGYKVRESKLQKSPQGEMNMATDFKEYKEVDGILFPHVIIQPMGGGMNMNIVTESIIINGEVDDDIFQE